VGMTRDMITPFFGRSAVVVIMLLSSICKALCGIAATASTAIIHQHWGSMMGGDIADVVSTNNALMTACSLVVVTVGTILFSRYAQTVLVAWTLYVALTGAHMYSNFKAMKSVALRTINPERYQLLLEHFFGAPAVSKEIIELVGGGGAGGGGAHKLVSDAAVSAVSQHMWDWLNKHRTDFSPATIAVIEPVLPAPLKRLFGRAGLSVEAEAAALIKQQKQKNSSSSSNSNRLSVLSPSPQPILWCSPVALSARGVDVQAALKRYSNERYFIALLPGSSTGTDDTTSSNSGTSSSSNNICVCFAYDVTHSDVAQAMFEVELTRAYMRRVGASSYDALAPSTTAAIRKITPPLFTLWWKYLGGRNADLSWDTARPQLLASESSALALSLLLSETWQQSFMSSSKNKNNAAAPPPLADFAAQRRTYRLQQRET
jgi:hypothetical protein